jgi:hypothetical protein
MNIVPFIKAAIEARPKASPIPDWASAGQAFDATFCLVASRRKLQLT